jgi:hypothetical protein
LLELVMFNAHAARSQRITGSLVSLESTQFDAPWCEIDKGCFTPPCILVYAVACIVEVPVVQKVRHDS